jgi:hypothetical protein
MLNGGHVGPQERNFLDAAQFRPERWPGMSSSAATRTTGRPSCHSGSHRAQLAGVAT